MADYNFETLNSIDFEHLVRDLLNARLKAEGSTIEFQSFAPGKDRGIDLLDSNSKKDNYNWIVQVKHQLNTPYDLFLSHLYKSTKTHKSEYEKIKKLSPNKFTLATSRALTLGNKEEIVEKMGRYMNSTQDILDREKLNYLLTQFPEVELNHPKLWFSSVAVFNKIFYNDLLQKATLLKSDILQKFRLYVSVYSIDNAISILQNTQLLVITGEPGCGKSTFAEMVLQKLIAMDFTSYWIDKSISEVEGILSDNDAKQVFYYDDFLGHTRYEIEIGKSKEKGLLHFLRNLKHRTNKYFILTTRTALINEAAGESERFRRSAFFLDQQEIRIEKLTIETKLKMIKNHLVVMEVPEQYTLQLDESRMLAIARHQNFSPRIIEFVTLMENYETVDAENYCDYILNHLNNPHEVWLHAYEQQLNDYDRFLMTTLYSFRGAVSEQVLARAFECRILYETATNHIPRITNGYKVSLNKLLGSFITFKHFFTGERLDFINPSLEDFLNFYLNDNDVETIRILNSFLYIEQVYSRFRWADKGYINVKPGKLFSERLVNTELDTISDIPESDRNSYIALYSAILNHMFLRQSNDIKNTLNFLQKVNWDELTEVNEFHMLSFLQIATQSNELVPYISSNFDMVVIAQFRCCKTLNLLPEIKALFTSYNKDYKQFISRRRNHDDVKQLIDDFFENELADLSENLRETATDIVAVTYEGNRMKTEIADIYKAMDIADEVTLKFFDLNWEVICANNHFNYELVQSDEARGPIRFDPDD